MNRLHAAIVVAVVAGLTLPVLSGQPAAAAPVHVTQLSLAAAESAAKIDGVPAQYVILADTSESMRAGNRYGELRTALRKFFSALAPDDRLTLITFDKSARVAYNGAVGSSPDKLMKHVPTTASGQYTDIGAAISRAVTALAKTRTSIATVVLVTDGEDDPPSGSHYPYTQGFAWKQLEARAAKLHQQVIKAYALPLTGRTGASLLDTVFRGRTTTLNPAAIGQITSRLAQPKEEIRAIKFRTVVAGDMRKGITVRWPDQLNSLHPGGNHLTVTLHSTTTRMPLVVSGIDVDINGVAVRAAIDDDTPRTIEPGKDVSVPLTINWSAGKRTLRYESLASTSYTLRLTADVQSPWSKAARQVGLTFAPTVADATVSETVTANLGRPWLWILGWTILGFLVLSLLLAAYRTPRLSGTLIVGGPSSVSPEEFQLSGSGRRTTIEPTVPGTGRIHVHARRWIGFRSLVIRGGAQPLARSLPLTLPPDELRMERSISFRWRSKPVPGADVTPPVEPVSKPLSHDRVGTTSPSDIDSVVANQIDDVAIASGPIPDMVSPPSIVLPSQSAEPAIERSGPVVPDRWADVEPSLQDEPGARLD